MNIPQTLEYVNRVYYQSVDLSELKTAQLHIKDLMENRRPTAENLSRAEGLAYRVNAKVVAIAYFDGGYEEEAFVELEKTLKEGLSAMPVEQYPKTVVIYQKLLSAATRIHEIVHDVGALLAGLQDANGKCVEESPEKLTYVERLFLDKKTRLEGEVEDTSALFGGSVAMFDIKARVVKEIDELYAWAVSERQALDNRDTESFIAHNFQRLEAIADFPLCAYTETLSREGYNEGKAYVLSSPLQDEIQFFITALAKREGISFLQVNAFAFDGKKRDFIEKTLASIEKQGGNLLIFGLKEYHSSNKDCLLEGLLRFSQKGKYVFAVDVTGSRVLYEEFMKIATSREGLSLLDVSCHYLRMPTFSQVINAYEERGMVSLADSEFVRANMLYMGYVGLNKSIWLFTNQKDWKDCALLHSVEHSGKIADYLRNLPSQDQFISRDWIDLGLGEGNVVVRAEFDYDAVHTMNPKNIQKIVRSDKNLFIKCGLSARYCMLCGDDYSVWQTLEREEREKRIAVATKLVAYLLNCIYTPEVKITPDEEWTRKGAGGYCANGGKLIVYKNDCTLSYDWAVKAICHECYHAFQHSVIESGFSDWHFTSLGVSKHRPSEWNTNFQRYVSIEKNREGYMRQVVEADARIFEEDCFVQSANKMQLFDWE